MAMSSLRGPRFRSRPSARRSSWTLTRNDALTRNLPAAVQARLGAAEFYTGTLAGNDASWVRLTRTGTALSGALWDGTELYAIEQFERVAAHVVAGAAVAPADPIIYRWADTLSALTDSLTTPAVPGGAAAPQKPATAPEIFDELAAAAEQADTGAAARHRVARGQRVRPTVRQQRRDEHVVGRQHRRRYLLRPARRANQCGRAAHVRRRAGRVHGHERERVAESTRATQVRHAGAALERTRPLVHGPRPRRAAEYTGRRTFARCRQLGRPLPCT